MWFVLVRTNERTSSKRNGSGFVSGTKSFPIGTHWFLHVSVVSRLNLGLVDRNEFEKAARMDSEAKTRRPASS